ncbi:hypothetical protein K474DRAFT_1777188 [Panus rudis PR-1116 ss-1]|nr:hypothetical protein K474DRAFT_1777188 [Panus rudis PR-1116 ss-1]
MGRGSMDMGTTSTMHRPKGSIKGITRALLPPMVILTNQLPPRHPTIIPSAVPKGRPHLISATTPTRACMAAARRSTIGRSPMTVPSELLTIATVIAVLAPVRVLDLVPNLALGLNLTRLLGLAMTSTGRRVKGKAEGKGKVKANKELWMEIAKRLDKDVFRALNEQFAPPTDEFALTIAWLTGASSRKLWGIPNDCQYGSPIPDCEMLSVRNILHQYAPKISPKQFQASQSQTPLKDFFQKFFTIILANGDKGYAAQYEALKLDVPKDSCPRRMVILSTDGSITEEDIIRHLASTGFLPTDGLLAKFKKFAQLWLADSLVYVNDGSNLKIADQQGVAAA